MKILKWLLGIPIALGIIIGLITIIVDSSESKSYFSKSLALDVVCHFLAVFSLFFLLVFLCSFIASPPKRHAGKVTLYIAYIFAISSIIVDFFVIKNALSYILGVSYLGLFTGPLVGYLVSSKVLKNNGWVKPTYLHTGGENHQSN